MADLYRRANGLLLITTLPLVLSPRDLLAANCEIWAFATWTARHQWLCFIWSSCVCPRALRKMKQKVETACPIPNDVTSRLGKATVAVGSVPVWPLRGP